ncbi:MAG TPA: ATP-binding protein [Rhodocyclaceae bacterium]|nr:ATP-binding protein [Rhodocyclaceae bacterium]
MTDRKHVPTAVAIAADYARALHELQVHQIELETQNEELRRVQAEAEAARARYQDLYEFAPVGYFTLTPQGRILQVNRAGADLAGRPQSQLVDQRLSNLVVTDERHQCERFLRNLAQAHGKETCELTWQRADGGTVAVRLEGIQAEIDHEFLVVAQDIGPHKRAEHMLREATAAAEQANRAKSTFLTNMSHEIRTPLHIIVGLSQLLARDVADPNERQRVTQLCANAEHLLALVNNVLDLSRIEAERLVLDRNDFRLGDMVERVINVIAAPAQTKGLALHSTLAPGLEDARVQGDTLRLTQILINLGSNAVKFTEVGEIRIAVECVDQSEARLRLRFSVKDTGIGIAAADQARLFDTFTQVDSTPTRVHSGSGLGLAISRRLVELMGGHIALQSSPGKGSTFGFELDLPRAAAPKPAVNACKEAFFAAAANLQGRRVLLAEDHLLSQEILLDMLEELGCVADVARDGAEALELARAGDYDLVLMDMQMPKLDGPTAARAILALPHHRDTPIVALTANVFFEDRQTCLNAGMKDHLGKPVTTAALAATLAKWLPGIAVPGGQDRRNTAANTPLGRALAAIPQLDADSVFRRETDGLAEYCQLLRRYLDTHGDDMARLEAHLSANERDAARVIVHNLKGISGLMGAASIEAHATDLHEALRADNDGAALAPLITRCATELQNLALAMANLPEQMA